MSDQCCNSNAGSTSSSNTSDNEGFIPTDENPIKFTAAAVAAIKNAIKEEGQQGDGLRVSVMGGGCSGLQYTLDFDRESRMGDVVIEADGVSIYVDSVSVNYLRGTVIDYVSGLNGTGFKFNNPNAKRTCGCGSSFS